MHKLIVVSCLVALLAFTAACVPVNERAMDDSTSAPVEEEAPVETLPPEETTIPAEEDLAEEPDAKFTVTGTEGDLIRLNPKAVDPDNDFVRYTFSPPFSKNGEWQTNVGDEGVKFISVTADDGKGGRTTETVKVIVARANRPPVVDCKVVTVNEGDMIDLHDSCAISDEDDEEVVVRYGGWMTSWRYQTTYDDAGTHTVTITASDKRKSEILHTVTKDVRITIKNVNRPPVFNDDFPELIRATENDVITLPKNLIVDPDKDRVTVTYSEPFGRDGVWKTKLGDAGTYDVDVVATDGEHTAKRTVRIELGLLNTAPTLKPISDITVDEGQSITLPISATDREGDALTVTVTGWMTSETYTTGYEDAGQYTVKVSVGDGEFTTDEVIQITVRDKNRPPVFTTPA